METKRITVVAAGLSEPSSTRMLADRLAEATEGALLEHEVAAEITVVELRTLAVDIASMMVTRVETAAVQEAIKQVVEADAIIAVTPTFTMSYSGLFKSFFDLVDKDALTGVPVLLGATGGTARHSMVLDTAMRPLFAYLKAAVIPTGVYAASEEWATSGLSNRVQRAGRELASVIRNLPRARATDPFDPEGADFETFDQLIGRS
ncbi:FMN reductase [uncultured Agrococcus sp.]|uniref:FMN reductase n=1 Tax=uncultured Agrococcus sp. TaxID=382258 RepID=UPI0025DC6360|nr:FMN reductase [uncultured Agrococcus sp.]